MNEPPRTPPTLGRGPGAAFDADDDDPSIPLLTERLILPALELDIALPHRVQPEPSPAVAAPALDGKAADAQEPAATEAPWHGEPAEVDVSWAAAAAVEVDAAASPDVSRSGLAIEPLHAPASLRDVAPELGADGEILIEPDADLAADIDVDRLTALDANFEAILAVEACVGLTAEPAAPDAVSPDRETTAWADAEARAQATAVSTSKTRAVADTVSAAEPTATAEIAATDEPAPDHEMPVDAATPVEPGQQMATAWTAESEPPPEPDDIASVGASGASEVATTFESAAAEPTAPAEAIVAADAPDAAADETVTEVDPEAAAEAAPAQPLSAAEPPPVIGGITAGNELTAERAPPPRGLTTDELALQADALRAAVLDRLAHRLSERVDATVRDLMQPAIDQAILEAQRALRITLQDLVDQALREALAARAAREWRPAGYFGDGAPG